MRVLFDTNVILDVLLDREPFSDAATALLARVERGEVSGYLCATTFTTIFYLLSKAIGASEARTHVNSLLEMFDVASVGRAVVKGALLARFADFEDAVLNEAAQHAGVQCIVTRNMKDFKHATLPVYLPDELLAILPDSPARMCHQDQAVYG